MSTLLFTMIKRAIYLFIMLLLLLNNTGCQFYVHKGKLNSNNDKKTIKSPTFICHRTDQYLGKVIGDGHCVSLIKQCTAIPHTTYWRPGNKVINSDIIPGTVIATFKNGRYPSKSGYHAAIYLSQTNQGIWVLDQWQGKAVHKRLIRFRNNKHPASNNAYQYRTVTLDVN